MKTQYPSVVYEFQRAKIEKLDYQHFLDCFGADKLPVGPRLKGAMGRLAFSITGYEHDPREIILIPEVRRFYSSLSEVWPFWLFFGDLSLRDSWKVPYLCRLNKLTVKHVAGNPYCAIRFDRKDILNLLWEDLPHLTTLGQRAGLTPRQIYERSREVFGFFQLPFGD